MTDDHADCPWCAQEAAPTCPCTGTPPCWVCEDDPAATDPETTRAAMAAERSAT